MEAPRKLRKSRGSSPEKARKIRQEGHDLAKLFALFLGLPDDYRNDPKAKKDVIDPSGDAHSVKGGVKKWQIFLYSKSRFEEFIVMNGIGELLINCIDSFPEKYEDYIIYKELSKQKLRPHMVELANKLSDKRRLKAFLEKSIFNGGEVDYLTVYDDNKFHVFYHKDVCEVMANNFEVTNSKARTKDQIPEQKVLFRYKGKNVGELEMRNDSAVHYKELRFNMIKPKAMELLYENVNEFKDFSDEIRVYGSAIKKFGNWRKQ